MTFTPEQMETQRAFMEACAPNREPAPHVPGITIGESASEYHRRTIGVASKSGLDELHRSPAHYRVWAEGGASESTPALTFGNAFHCLLLEPDRFAASYVVKPSGLSLSKKDGVAWKEANGITGADDPRLLNSDSARDLFGMQAAVMRHPAASRIVCDGAAEVSLRWVDAETGVRCKARADYWVKRRRLCADLKSTEDARPEEFAKSVARWRYHVQDAFYRAGFDALGEPIEHFALVCVEKHAPYAVAVYTLDMDAVRKGYTAARIGIERLAECIRNDSWPAYHEGVSELSLPQWAA